MNILFLSAEVSPFVSVGGLSQVMYFLPRALSTLGNDVRMFTAHYGGMDKTAPKKNWPLQIDAQNLNIPIENNGKNGNSIVCSVAFFKGDKHTVPAYFLQNDEFYRLRANVFGYGDDHLRFTLLSKGCLEWLLAKYQQKDAWFPDIIHCNDWHTGYFIELARTNPRYKEILAKIPIVLTVHNFAYQGNYDFQYVNPDQRDRGETPLASLDSDKLQRQNALLRGMIYADEINTVSPTHAIEVLTPQYSQGLEDTLAKVRGKLIGILNGLDTREFNPARDPIIKKRYSIRSFSSVRDENKKWLQKEFELPVDTNKTLIAYSGRLAGQKGLDLLLETLPHLLTAKKNVQYISIGSGEDRYRQGLLHLKESFPTQVGLHLRADFRLPRRIFAGSDIIVMPSIYEPGGIVALEALRYGCVPVVRRTGGLNDIIKDFDPNTKKGNGFSFTQIDNWSFYTALIEALSIYNNKQLWKTLVRNCLQCNFSWEKVALEYANWYTTVMEERKRATSLNPHPAYSASTPTN